MRYSFAEPGAPRKEPFSGIAGPRQSLEFFLQFREEVVELLIMRTMNVMSELFGKGDWVNKRVRVSRTSTTHLVQHGSNNVF